MKRILLLSVVALMATIAFAQEEEELDYDYVGGRKWYVSFGSGANIVGDVGFGSGRFEVGYYINPQNLLSVEFGGGSYTEAEIGWFHYTSGGSLHTNGVINYDYTSALFLVSWSYVKDLSDRFQWRIGPSAGLLSVSGGLGFDPSGIRGLPNEQSKGKSAFAFGANTGITWNFSTKKRWFLDLGYRLYGNTGISLDERIVAIGSDVLLIDEKKFSNVGNQINLTVGWRFGKAYW